MSIPNQEAAQVADALNRLSGAMEQFAARYDATERANRRVRVAVILVLIFLGGVMYKTLAPVAEQLGALPQIVSQALPALRPVKLDPEAAAAERRRLMEVLPPEQRARIEIFEREQQWVSDYIAATEGFDPGATIALFLSNMAESVEAMPEMSAAVSSMTDHVRVMNQELQIMNKKMSSIPVLAAEVKGMHTQMTALPVLATDVKGMHFFMSVMAKDLDSTMGEAGRMMPWNW